MANKRTRKIFSVKNELLAKSKESALCAVQIYNNPNITFKSESFIVLMIIAWTYLLHAHYRERGIEYRYFKQVGSRRKFEKTAGGRIKYWELERCLGEECPLDSGTKSNLRFLINLRHEIEHQMTNRIDDYISGKLQACCLNYNTAIGTLFNQDIAHYQPISLQFCAFGKQQIDNLKDKLDIPKNIIDFVSTFEAGLEITDKQSQHYSYRVIYMRDHVSQEGRADAAIRFINDGLEQGKQIQDILVKHRQYEKLTQSDVVSKMKAQGYSKFNKQAHQVFWQSKWRTAADRNAKAKQYGELVVNNQWLWYEDTWIPVVTDFCKSQYPANKHPA